MFHLIFWVFVLILALSYFGISLEAIITSPAGRENFGYLYHLLLQGWQFFVDFITHIYL